MLGAGVGVGAGEGAGAAEAVGLTGAAEVLGAGGIGAAAREEATGATGAKRCLDVLEDAALDEDLGAGVELKGVSLAVVPVVVDGVEKRVAADLGGAAGHVVNEVVLEGDHL